MNYMGFKPGGDQCVGEAKAVGYQWISLEAGSKTRDHSSQVLGQAPRLIFRMKLSGPKLLTVFLLPGIEDRLLSQSVNRFQVPTSVGRLLLA